MKTTSHRLNTYKTTPSTPMKVFCDASHIPETNMAYGGWMFCNHFGKPIDLCSESLGSVNKSHKAEIGAISRALLALSRFNQVQHVIIFSDCEPAVDKYNGDDYSNAFESVKIKWIPRQENIVADLLANEKMWQYKSPPSPPSPKYGMTD